MNQICSCKKKTYAFLNLYIIKIQNKIGIYTFSMYVYFRKNKTIHKLFDFYLNRWLKSKWKIQK